MLPPRNVKAKGKQITAFISDEHKKMFLDICTHYTNAYPFARVAKYKVLETIIEEHYKNIFDDKSSL